MAETNKTALAVQRTDPAIKVLIALAAAILALLILAVTFTGGFFAGSYTGRKAVSPTAALGRGQGMMGQQFDRQDGRGNNQKRLQQMGGGMARGEVTDVTSDSVVVDDVKTGDKITVEVTSDTTIIKAGQAATLADISKGEIIAAIGTLSGDTLTAKVIKIGAGGMGGGMRGGQGGMMGPGGPGF